MIKMSFLIITSCLLLTTQSKASFNMMRLLADIQVTREKTCQNILNKYEGIKGFDSVNDYFNSLNLAESKSQDFLLNLVIKGSTEGLTDFLKDIGIYIFMIALAAIVLVIWPFMWCCCCCNCCIFSNKKKKGCCGLAHLIISLSLIGAVIIVSIISLFQSKTFIQNFNGSICSLFTFFQTAIIGEEGDKIPKWGGAQGISDSLKKSIESINNLKSSYPANSLPKEKVKTDQTGYQTLIDDNQKPYTIPNPGKMEGDANKEMPVYDKEFADKTNKIAFIGQIQEEKEKVIDTSIKALINLNNVIAQLNGSGDFENIITGIADLLTSFNSLLTSATNILGENIVQVQRIATDVLLLAFDILYGIFLALAVACFAILLVYILCKCYCLKIFLHIFWNVIFVLTILSFIIGALLGIIGVVGSQINPVVYYVLSPDFISGPNSPFSSPEQAKALDSCINGDGDLIAALGIDTSGAETQNLDLIVKLSVQIENYKTQLAAASSSAVIPLIITQMAAFKASIDSTHASYKTILDKINQDLDTCTGVNNRFYVSGQSPSTSSSASWFMIDGTTSIPSVTCQPSGISENMDTRTGYVQASVKNNNDNLSEIAMFLQTLSNDYEKLIQLIIVDLDSAKTYTSSLYDTYGEIVGEKSLFSMFNCKFLRFEIMNFFDQLGNKFAYSSRMIGICCLFCAFASFIGIFFIMSTIYYYSKDAREEEETKFEY